MIDRDDIDIRLWDHYLSGLPDENDELLEGTAIVEPGSDIKSPNTNL